MIQVRFAQIFNLCLGTKSVIFLKHEIIANNLAQQMSLLKTKTINYKDTIVKEIL